MNFIGKIRQNEKAVFLGKVIFFYLLMIDSMDAFYCWQRILADRRLIYEQF